MSCPTNLVFFNFVQRSIHIFCRVALEIWLEKLFLQIIGAVPVNELLMKHSVFSAYINMSVFLEILRICKNAHLF